MESWSVLFKLALATWSIGLTSGDSNINLFTDYENQTTVAGLWSGLVSSGMLEWESVNLFASFHIGNQIVLPSEVDAIKLALAEQEFDQDPDSVDGENTFEFYLERNHGITDKLTNIPLKPDAYSPSVLLSRKPIRKTIQKITNPIVTNRILPLINKLYPECNGRCSVCHSLVRRYLTEERRRHAMHFDLQAFITVVVALSNHGTDFEGGLYVSTNGRDNQSFIALQSGDAVIHQSDLLHGVDVVWGDRFSWIMWIKDSEQCDTNPASWRKQQAMEGDPISSFLYAHRLHLEDDFKTAPSNVVASEKFKWLRVSAKAGFSRAQNEVGMAYMDGVGVEINLQLAVMWFKRACKFEPDAFYNLGLAQLQLSKVEEAVGFFTQAAEAGCRSAMYNLAVAYFHGKGVQQDLLKAVHWFEKEGSASAFYKLSVLHAQSSPTKPANDIEAHRWLQRAANAGDPQACMQVLKQRTDVEESDVILTQKLLRCASDRGDVQATTQLHQYHQHKQLQLQHQQQQQQQHHHHHHHQQHEQGQQQQQQQQHHHHQQQQQQQQQQQHQQQQQREQGNEIPVQTNPKETTRGEL